MTVPITPSPARHPGSRWRVAAADRPAVDPADLGPIDAVPPSHDHHHDHLDTAA
jgi:L-ascorbate metabolism protein UlaG (beta-lactamase superfamily)